MIYLQILRDTYPEHSYSHIWEDAYKSFDWGIYINRLGEEGRREIEKLLALFTETVLISDTAQRTFALDYHMNPEYIGRGRT